MFAGLKKTNQNALIGIDFGSNSIKAIALSKGRGTFQIDAVAEAPIAKGLIVDNHFEDITKLSQIIKQLRKNFPASYQNAAIAVTGADVITKVMPMNADLSEIDLEAQVELEAENSIPFPLDEIFLDFEVLGPNAANKELNDVLVSAARRETVLSQVDCVEVAGLKVKVVDVASHAQARACELLFERDDFDKGIAFIDIGASQMMLNIMHQGNVIFSRSKNHGGAVCTQMMADHYGMSFSEAEKVKVEHNWPVDCDIDVVAPFINMTVNHLRFDLRMFTNTPNNIQIDKIILTGGCQLMPELVKQLEEELDLNVEIASPFPGFEYKNESDNVLLQKVGAKYMLALGLALRGVQ
ncbi:pilus assembly protein PilM [Psychromonas aquimarina]|uniref:pilus assembly protein PilM n=1 Tax=Psychromonas aquimarina TaxID=444919 RepID=UPI0004226F67|nr:pilus assembly protein PilM [Psychromonas aquimarina]